MLVCSAVAAPSPWFKKLLKAFEEGECSGLTYLGSGSLPSESDASLMYWSELSGIFLKDLCRLPEGETFERSSLQPLEIFALENLVSKAPPFAGGEYLNLRVLNEIWSRWADWVCVASQGELNSFLHHRAPVWTRVGRVTLHLAENKDDAECPFAFMATYASGLNRRGGVLRQPLGAALKEFAGSKGKRELMDLLSPLQKASQQCELMEDLLESRDVFHPLLWTASEAHVFLSNIPIYEECGLLVQIPNWWRRRARPSVSVTLDYQHQTTLGADALLSFNVALAMSGESLSAEEIRALLNSDEPLLRLRGQWVEVDRDKLSEALAHWEEVKIQHEEHGLSFVEGMRLLAGADAELKGLSDSSDTVQWSQLRAGDHLAQALQDLRSPDLIKGKQPKTLKATLRPYQVHGLNWLTSCARLGLGACLADDMGLGKTMQVLAMLLRHKLDNKAKFKGPSLLVAPTSLLNNWKAEAEKFAPTLNLIMLHPSLVSKEQWQTWEQEEGKSVMEEADLVITSYGMLSRVSWLASVTWLWQILDEAQAIKTPSTAQTKAAKKIVARHRIALTGTPVENRLGDLWSIFDFINPGLLGSVTRFKAFSKSLQSEDGVDYGPLRRLVAPYILRRMKTDPEVAGDLPDKVEVSDYCSLTRQQLTLYSSGVKELAKSLAEGDRSEMQRRGLVLKYLTLFKQICNHPGQYRGDGQYEEKHSGKFVRVRELCEEISSRGERVLVFTQFREIMDPLDELLRDVFGRTGLMLHGGTSVKARKAMVDDFQREDGPPYFILSLKAGGTGLTLTAATQVIHFDRWWNPAVENQATDRAYRIGQKNKVMVHKLVTKGTLEERVDAMLREKQAMSDALLDGQQEVSFSEMNDEELMDLVSLDIEQVMT